MAKAAGIDPIRFGVVVIMNLSIGTFTPPVAINLFVGQAVFTAPPQEHHRFRGRRVQAAVHAEAGRRLHREVPVHVEKRGDVRVGEDQPG